MNVCIQVNQVDGLAFRICKKFKLNKETEWCGPDFPFVLMWGWALTVWSTLTGLDWESKRGLLLGFRNQALASYAVTQSICFIGGMQGGGERNQASKPPNTTAVPPSNDPVPGDQAKLCFDIECLTVVVNVLGEQLKCALGVRRPSVWEWPVLFQGRSNSSAEFGGPMGRDSSPGYSWLNLRQTAGTDED